MSTQPSDVEFRMAWEVYESMPKLLEAWAQWRRENHGVDVGFPGCSTFSRFITNEGESNIRALPVSDNVALRVDGAVGQLKLRSHPVSGDYRWEAICFAYLGTHDDKQVARHIGISRSTARTSRIAGENWLEGHLLTTPELTRN